MKAMLILLLAVASALAGPPGWTNGLFYTDIQGGMRIVNYELWGGRGEASVNGYSVPQGEVWVIRGAGIITDDGAYIEWMLQLNIPFPGHRPNPQLLVPIKRENGTAAGTPTLALEKDCILLPGECVTARALGLRKDRYMGIRFSAFVLPISELSNLIK